ncbi:MAG: hypothetical protein K2N90_01065, partial [Lachnospiraceae bacterium]|nr:hypothetical protein [Lachnospiraceae bacterium]
ALMVVARRQKQVMCINGIAMVLVIILSLRFIPIWGIDGVNYILFAVYMAGIAFMGILVVITIRKNFAVDMNGHRS